MLPPLHLGVSVTAALRVNSESEQIDSWKWIVNCHSPSRGQSEKSVLFGQLSRGESGPYRPAWRDGLMGVQPSELVDRQMGKKECGTAQVENNRIESPWNCCLIAVMTCSWQLGLCPRSLALTKWGSNDWTFPIKNKTKTCLNNSWFGRFLCKMLKAD